MDESFAKDPLSHQHFLTFVLRDECFGISISAVKEIIEYDNVTPIPLMPEFVKGVLNLRGEVVPVIDLSVRFNKAPTEIQKRTCIVILEIPFEEQTVTIGAVVDSVSEVMEINMETIEPAPTFGARIRAQFILGVVNTGDQFVILLRGERVLSVEEMTAVIENVVEK
ncbi:chemotaxis protein CheW [Rheinheimera sp. 4Y26]|uniref:chemotaxis protein CheW n=1 Tax=Rheinheimera sp. 4Y26 TaxID=2977811 RepID=UPI0021B0C4A7|nr:chemotaxis protein CheW [Rheinheimera sp. 4Y26]MCT6699381.1 chemotaxis protein CheW [Rheinheimera sp. 4Y26]